MMTQHVTSNDPDLSFPSSNFKNSENDSDVDTNSDFDECPICMSLGEENDIYWLFECGHYFCTSCLVNYLESQISELNVLKIKCPQDCCERFLAESLIQRILDKPTFERYQQAFVQKINNKNSVSKFCPQPGCSKPFTPDNTLTYTTCTCKTEICNVCCNFRHDGKTCFEALDRDFQLYAQENDVKFCVMCKTIVTKVEGCVHITCPICDYEWCWLCGQEHSDAHAWSCKRVWDPLPPANILKEGVEVKKEPWKVRAKAGFVALGWFLLLMPLRVFFWPFFKFFFRGQNTIRDQPLDEKIILAILSFFFSFMYDGLIGEVASLIFRFPEKWMFLGSCLLFLMVVPWVSEIYENFKKKTIKGRWTTRNSQSFQYTENAKPTETVEAQGNNANNHIALDVAFPQEQILETSVVFNEKSQAGLLNYHSMFIDQTDLSTIETMGRN